MNPRNTTAKKSLLADFILRPCRWDETAAAWSKLLPHDSPEDYGAHFSKLVKEGKAAAYEVTGPTGRVAIVVGTINRTYALPELMILGAISAENMQTATEDFLPEIEAKARELGCATVCFHTMRPGLVAKFLKQGGELVEVVCRKDVRK